MLDRCAAELLERVFGHLPVADLLNCLRVSRRFHLLIRRRTDWQRERRRLGPVFDGHRVWFGRHMSTGLAEPPTKDADPALEQQLDAMAELARSLAAERQICAQFGATAEPQANAGGAHGFLSTSFFSGTYSILPPATRHKDRVSSADGDPRCWGGWRTFYQPVDETWLTALILPVGDEFVLLGHRRLTRQVVLYHMHVRREEPLAEQVVATNTSQAKTCPAYTSGDRLCFFLWTDADGYQAMVFSTPSIQPVAKLALPWCDFGFYRYPISMFFDVENNALMCFDIQTVRTQCECTLPQEPADVSLSSDDAHLIVFCQQRLHVFEAPADYSPTDQSKPRRSLRAVRALDGDHRVHCRDGHVLALPQTPGPASVFDLDLRPLWRVQGDVSCPLVYFVGQNLLVSWNGLVFDWRTRRSYIGTIKYNLALRLNKRRGGPCEHVRFAEYGPCLACFEVRAASKGLIQ